MVLSGSGGEAPSETFVPNEPRQILGHDITYMGQEFADDGSRKYYVFTVDGQRVTALTKLRKNGEDAAREPAINRTFSGDVYLAPTPVGGEREEISLARGEIKFVGEFAYIFEQAEITEDNGKMIVTASVGVTNSERTEVAQPSIVATKDGGTSSPTEVFDGAARIRLTALSADHKKIRLELLPSLKDEIMQPITASVSFKPYIWLLWVGCVLVAGGSFVAAKK